MINASIHLRCLSKQFLGKIVIKNFEECFYPGEVIGIIGKNGVGKTTLIKLISGLIRPDAGEVLIFSKNNEFFHKDCMLRVGTLLENSRALYWRLSVWRNFVYFSGLKGIFGKGVLENAKKILNLFGLWELKNVIVETLSTGMKQRMAIVSAICHDPSIILLDEPTIGLDHDVKQVLVDMIKRFSEEKKTIVVTSHDHNFISSVSGKIYKIENSGLDCVF